jgi:hypothetical protein
VKLKGLMTHGALVPIPAPTWIFSTVIWCAGLYGQVKVRSHSDTGILAGSRSLQRTARVDFA